MSVLVSHSIYCVYEKKFPEDSEKRKYGLRLEVFLFSEPICSSYKRIRPLQRDFDSHTYPNFGG